MDKSTERSINEVSSDLIETNKARSHVTASLQKLHLSPSNSSLSLLFCVVMIICVGKIVTLLSLLRLKFVY